MDHPIDEESDPNKLETTNRLLSDLERKLSFISTTSSNQTQHSQGSSVIINKNMTGIAKQNIQSTVLQYIKNDDDTIFSPDDLFQERQAKFMTKFGKHYNDDNSRRYLKGATSPKLHPNRSIHIHEDEDDEVNQNFSNQDILDGLQNDMAYTSTPKTPPSTDDVPVHEILINSQDSPQATSIHSPPEDTVEVDDPEGLSFERPDESYNEDDIHEHSNEEIADEDDEEDEEEDEYNEKDDFEDNADLLLPPSPPRSPPKELDPDKLYGLYDFSGPDPSHCSLSRDEPVFLINDQDNYWWLIRKMNKEERILHRKRRIGNKRSFLRSTPEADSDDEDEDDLKTVSQLNALHSAEQDPETDSDEYDYTDEEDGKIGFVPAECLETYGERLARLNCFKNEELERTSKETFDDGTNNISSDSYGIDLANPINDSQVSQSDNSIFSRGDSLLRHANLSKSNSLLKHSNLSKSNSLLRRNGTKKNEPTKSVTFENLGELDLDDEEEDQIAHGNSDVEFIREQQRTHFENGNYALSHNDLKNDSNQLLAPPNLDNDDKASEVLSEIYPEAPLIVNKNNSKKKKALLPTKLTQPDGDESNSALADLIKPSFANTRDDSSIGSFSPDTPPTRNSRSKQAKQQFYTPEGVVDEAADGEDDEFKEINNNLTHLRRSVILDRLTKVTSDIEQQIILDHYGSSSNELEEVGEEDEDSEDDAEREITTPKLDEHNDTLKTPIIDQHNDTLQSPVNVSDGPDVTEVLNEDDYEYEYEYDFDDEEDEEREEDGALEHNTTGEFTPLTSMNSLNNGISLPTPKNTPLDEKRKSKPVHEMFMPILGKFDKLAEKLAELDSML